MEINKLELINQLIFTYVDYIRIKHSKTYQQAKDIRQVVVQHDAT